MKRERTSKQPIEETCPQIDRRAEMPFEDSAAYLLGRAAQEIRAGLAEALAPLKVSARQMVILELLRQREPLMQQEIGASLGIDRTSMVSLIDGLEKLALVVRECHPSDRRAYALRLTPEGHAAAAESRRILEHAQAEFLKPLAVGEWEILRKVLRKLLAGGGDVPECPGGDVPECPGE